MRKRILFIGEAVTLAHVVRPLVLARALDGRHYDVHFACAARSRSVLGDDPFAWWPIASLPAERFLGNLAAGAAPYDAGTLHAYVAEEIGLLRRVRPDLVVGDLRWSLPISAAVCNVPCAVLTNAYWSPYALGRRYHVPQTPLTGCLGVSLASALFHLAKPLAFAWYATLQAWCRPPTCRLRINTSGRSSGRRIYPCRAGGAACPPIGSASM